MKDDMLRAVATNGGVVNVNFAPGFVTESYRLGQEKLGDDMWEEIEDVEKFARRAPVAHWSGTPEYVEQQKAEIRQQRRQKSRELQLPTLSGLVDHIDHIGRVAGIDHVGLGSDFDGIGAGPVGLEDCSKFPAITEELLKREYAEADIKYYCCMRAALVAHMQGHAPVIAVEFARKMLFPEERPSFIEVEDAMNDVPTAA